MSSERTSVRIGVDLGGTKIEALVLDGVGREAARLRVPTPRSYEDVIAALTDLCRAAAAKVGASHAHVGVGMPGSLSPVTGLARNCNLTALNGRAFGADAEAALGWPMRFANDANCFALSEAMDGAAAGAHSVFGTIVGSGVGGGLVIDGSLITGANGVSGEWGHIRFPRGPEEPEPRICWCGRPDCMEVWLNGAALAKDDPVRAAAGGTSRDVAEAALAGDAAAQAAVARYANRLARALSIVVNLIDPDVIVLGGGVSNVTAIYPLVEAALPDHVLSDTVTTRVLQNVHGDSSGVRGAAWLWREEEL